MPITLITGPANSGKAELAMDAVRRHMAHGEDPLLVVPTRADADHYLRELAGEGAAMGVRLERFAGLLSEAVRRAGVREPVLAGIARERLLEALAARAGVPATPGFVAALAAMLAELEVRRVTPARLGQALSQWASEDGPRPVQARLGRLFGDYRATLERLGRVDGEQCAVRALDLLRERPALWGATPVVVYGFDDLTPLQLDAIETLGRVVDAEVTVSLAYEPGRAAFAGRAASFHALAPLAHEHRALPARAEHYAPAAREALSHLERRLFEPFDPDARRAQPGIALRLLEGEASAQSWSWWHRGSRSCSRKEWRRRRSPCWCAPRAWRWSCWKRYSRHRACRLRCSGAGSSGTRRPVRRYWACCAACPSPMGPARASWGT